MTSARPRFDVATLRERAGDKVFARGEPYSRNGSVDIFAVDGARVLAEVHGSETYRVEVSAKGKRIDGRCSCPAFDDAGFCKHLVATALAANAAGDDADGVGAIGRIREHLKGKSVDALVDMIVGIAEGDAALLRKLDGQATAATVSGGDVKTIEARLRKLVDGATRTGSFVDYAGATDWSQRVADALDAVADLPPQHAQIALKLAGHAIDRIEDAIERIDDSDGCCSDLLVRAGEIHHAAAVATRPEPKAFASELFAREMGGGFDTFVNAASRYADVLGEAGLAEYRRLAQSRWHKPEPDDEWYERQLVLQMLDFFAERDGDLDARIALRVANLPELVTYLQLGEFCLEHGRETEALHWAEDGLRASDAHYVNHRLVVFAAMLSKKHGRDDAADAHLRHAFERQPDLELYRCWRDISGVQARDRAIAFLASRLEQPRRRSDSSPAPLLAMILMREKRFDAAWDVACRFDVGPALKYALAEAREKTHPQEALDIYAQRVDELARTSSYEEAATLVRRMAALRSVDEQENYVAALKARFGRKRNFMKLLG